MTNAIVEKVLLLSTNPDLPFILEHLVYYLVIYIELETNTYVVGNNT